MTPSHMKTGYYKQVFKNVSRPAPHQRIPHAQGLRRHGARPGKSKGTHAPPNPAADGQTGNQLQRERTIQPNRHWSLHRACMHALTLSRASSKSLTKHTFFTLQLLPAQLVHFATTHCLHRPPNLQPCAPARQSPWTVPPTVGCDRRNPRLSVDQTVLPMTYPY